MRYLKCFVTCYLELRKAINVLLRLCLTPNLFYDLQQDMKPMDAFLNYALYLASLPWLQQQTYWKLYQTVTQRMKS